MTVLVFTFLFGLSFVVFPCEGKISLPREGDTFLVAPGSEVKIAWTFDDKIADLVIRAWRFIPTGKLLALIVEDKEPAIKDSGLPRVSIEKPSTLVLKNVELSHNGTYKFQIEGAQAADPSYVTVFVAVQPTMRVCSTPFTVDEDKNVTCLCRGENGQPPANVTWYNKNGVQIGDTGDEVQMLSLSKVNENSSGTYKCVGQSFTLKAEKSIEVIVRLNVQPRVTSFTSGKAVLGKSVTLTCDAEGRPSPSYAITHNDTDTVSTEKTYKIDKVKYSDAGWYKCTAKNKLGDNSVVYNLTVLVMSIVTVNCSSPVTVNEGDNVKCLCKGEGGNPPTKVTWYKDGVQQGVAQNKENILSLSNVDKADSGTYKCAAQSYFLTDEKSIEIIIDCVVQKTTVAMAIANSLNKVESVVVWHIVVSLLSGILVGVLLSYIIQYFRRRCRNSKLESNPQPPTTITVDSIYQDLDLNRMNEEENYESLRSVNCDSNDPSGKNESDYTDLTLDRVVEDNYQTLTKT